MYRFINGLESSIYIYLCIQLFSKPPQNQLNLCYRCATLFCRKCTDLLMEEILNLRYGPKHKEILQSPWLIELGAFCMNCDEPDGPNLFSSSFSCNLNAAEPVITLMLPDSVTLEYNLNCAICLVM
ncbi:hypothetical protein RHMOL_Rhmol03G0063500 [Rhododendron molle]|uniref:Uncharacterized protein n=1 Tax=Rhododendron molle TaxID=49168 RepID=A0ACC0PBK3_RHOML|nr:hypothetical protein RHMOL_Rhmol03G0063500 [Rhododendron molle]